MSGDLDLSKKSIIFTLPVIIGLAFPVAILAYFYITYAHDAWFYSDDILFIAQYKDHLYLNQLFDFTNFGRFVSRNAYWYLGIRLFSYNSQYFYIFNLFTITATSFLLYKIFENKYGKFYGIIAGLFFLVLPTTVQNYGWLSDSQHLLGHFFVFLFVYLLTKNNPMTGKNNAVQTIGLILILALGFESNIFMSMVLSLPVWLICVDKFYRKSKQNYIIVFTGIILCAAFIYKLSHIQEFQSGAYLSSYTFGVVVENLEFYFKNRVFAVLWLIAVVLGIIYTTRKKRYFIAWLFIASAVFIIPYCFLLYQRYDRYGELTYLFFLLAIWALLIEFVADRLPNFIKYIGVIAIFLIFLMALSGPVKDLVKKPLGAAQKQQIDLVQSYDMQHPDIKNYCFQPEKIIENTTGVIELSIPVEWWFTGVGRAFPVFVNEGKKFSLITNISNDVNQNNRFFLIQNSSQCDVIFTFKGSRLVLTDQH